MTWEERQDQRRKDIAELTERLTRDQSHGSRGVDTIIAAALIGCFGALTEIAETFGYFDQRDFNRRGGI